jgi:hypothetical protein
MGPALVDLAITHERGHAICHERNERKANDYEKELQARKVPRGSIRRSRNRVAEVRVATAPTNVDPK